LLSEWCREVSLRDYFFELEVDRDGRTLPFSRFDILMAAALGLIMLVALAYGTEGLSAWTPRRVIIVGASFALILILSKRHRVVFGGAAGIVAVRFLVGFLTGVQPIVVVSGAALFAAISWFLLKDL
jgi:hypothetical protein